MTRAQTDRPSFSVTHEESPPETLVVGFSEFGLAGLTAVHYLTDQLDLEESGHVTADGLPAITPFENGHPRHHTRIFTGDADVVVLVGELFVPPLAGEALATAVLEWMDASGVLEVTVLSGVPIAHGPDDHAPFFVATDDYREARLDGTDIQPMGRGFLDGLNAELVQRGLDTDRRVGLLTTPAHAQAPDVEAALRLLEAFTSVYDLDLDTGPLEAFAAEVEQHYSELAERMDRVTEGDRMEDRMYM